MPKIQVGDRVEYRFSPAAPGGDPKHNGCRGTVTQLHTVFAAGGVQAVIDWEEGRTPIYALQPWIANLKLMTAAKVPQLAPVTPITTEYEADSHHSDPVAHPSHYTQGLYEVWRVIRDWKLNFNRGSAVKYIARAGKKDDELQDLRKARQFLDFEIEALEAERKSL